MCEIIRERSLRLNRVYGIPIETKQLEEQPREHHAHGYIGEGLRGLIRAHSSDPVGRL